MAQTSANIQVEANLKIPGVTLELRQGVLSAESDFIMLNHEHWLTMGLSSRLDPSECHIPDPYSPKFYKIGNLSLRPAKIAHRIVTGPGRFRYLCFRIDPVWFADLTGIGGDWDLQTGFDIVNPEIDSFLLRLERELCGQGPANKILIEGLSLAIAADLATVLRGVQPRAQSDTGKLSVQQLQKIKDHIEGLEGDAPTIAGIADLVGMSSRHLMRVFKRTTNMTVYEFITRQRMRRAMGMLTETKLLIKEISHRLGFATIESFSSSFRAATGESPLAFRRRILTGGKPLRLDA